MRDSMREVIAAYGRAPLKVPRRCEELTYPADEWDRAQSIVSLKGHEHLSALARRIGQEMGVDYEASLWGVELWALGNGLYSPGELGKGDWAHISFPEVPALAGFIFVKEAGAPPETYNEFLGKPRKDVWFPRDAELELLLRGPLTKHLGSLKGDIERVGSLRIECSEVDEYILREHPKCSLSGQRSGATAAVDRATRTPHFCE